MVGWRFLELLEPAAMLHIALVRCSDSANFLSCVTPGYALTLFCKSLCSSQLLIHFGFNWQILACHVSGETVNDLKNKKKKRKNKGRWILYKRTEWFNKYKWLHTVCCTWGHTHLELENRNNTLLLFLLVREWITSNLCVLRNTDCMKSVLQPFAGLVKSFPSVLKIIHLYVSLLSI